MEPDKAKAIAKKQRDSEKRQEDIAFKNNPTAKINNYQNVTYTKSGIPRILHQIWFQGEKAIPEKYHPFQKRLKAHHKNYLYKLWDGESIGDLLKANYAWFYDLWNGLEFMIQKIDAAKMFILHSQGGVYLDMDMECIDNVENLLIEPLVLSRCHVNPVEAAGAAVLGLKNFAKTNINNGFIACTQYHPVMWNTIKLMQHTIKNTTNYLHSSYVAKTCGTEVMIEGLRQALRKDPTMPYAAYPPEFFEPKVQTLKGNKPMVTDNTRVIHHSDREWANAPTIARLQWVLFGLLLLLIFSIVVSAVVFFVWKYKQKKDRARRRQRGNSTKSERQQANEQIKR